MINKFLDCLFIIALIWLLFTNPLLFIGVALFLILLELGVFGGKKKEEKKDFLKLGELNKELDIKIREAKKELKRRNIKK